MKRIKYVLHFALFMVASFFFISLFLIVFVWAFGPYMAACFDFTEGWTLEDFMWLGEAFRNPY